MKSRKTKNSKKPAPKRKTVAIPPAVFEYVMLQLILRGSGFKSSEIATEIRERKENTKQSSVHMVITRKIDGEDKKHRIQIGILNHTLAKAQVFWTKWLTYASGTVIRNFDAWQKKSIAYVAIESILGSLEKAGFVIVDSDIEETFDLAPTVH